MQGKLIGPRWPRQQLFAAKIQLKTDFGGLPIAFHLTGGEGSDNHRAAVEHRRIYRPWGYYQDIDIAPRYRVKRIVVKPGSKLSLQKHFHRSEHWVVVKGTAEVTLGTDERSVHENESIYIPIGSIHRLANPGKIRLELIEVQVGSYLGEDDIVRLDDVYGRVAHGTNAV